MRTKKVFLLVDGYNIINNWDELAVLVDSDLESARQKFIDMMSEYAVLSGERVIIVFDAHQVKGSTRKRENYKGLELIYTRENETADAYIERRLDIIGRRDIVKVATSDSMIQNIILGRGGIRISASELKLIVKAEKDGSNRWEKKRRRTRDRNIVRLEDLDVFKEIFENVEEGKD